MNNLECTPGEEYDEWAKENKRWKIAPRPYPFKEAVIFLKNWVLGPSKKYKGTAEFIQRSSTINVISPEMKIGFLGDIMRMADRQLIIDESYKEFFKDIDYLVGNFEGIITTKYKKGAIGSQIHEEGILESLKELFPPEKTLLCISNNHAGDFGWEEFLKTYDLIKDHGFLVVGKRDEPTLMFDKKVNIATASFLSDQRCSYISNEFELDNYYNEKAKFNVFYPHWGFELQLYPHPPQIAKAKEYLEKWDLIVGHHTHNPQPITTYPTKNGNKVVAYSLGDFSYGLKWKRYHHYGLVMKAEIGPNKTGIWQTGQLDWQFTQLMFEDKKYVRATLVDSYKHFKNI
ncbi:MAG: CapA family protein [Candidatus Heimdallarchaeota archaeon]